MERASEVSRDIIRQYPDDLDAQKIFLSARLGIVYIYRLQERFDRAETTRKPCRNGCAGKTFSPTTTSPQQPRDRRDETSRGKMEEALVLNRKGLSVLTALREKWPQDPKIKNNLAASYADTGLSEWRLRGYTENASSLLHRGIAVLDGCPELMCKSRAAEIEGFAGLVDWSGGHA